MLMLPLVVWPWLPVIHAWPQVLRQDIRGTHQGRGMKESADDNNDWLPHSLLRDDPSSVSYMCRLDTLSLQFVTTAHEIVVESINLA